MAQQDDDLFGADFLSRIERVRLQVRQKFAGRLRAERRSRRTGSSLEFADTRNYVPGDDPRRIDWSVYGRLERLTLRLYEEEEDLDVGILVDCSASMHWRPEDGGRLTKFSLARQLAAALAYLALQGLDRVTLCFFDSELRAESSRVRGRPAFHEVLRFLRRQTGATGGTNLGASLGRFGRSRKRRGLAIVLSDCLDVSGWEPGLRALVGRRFAVHLLHIMAPEECDPPERGDLLLRDVEGGGEMKVTLSDSLRETYRREAARWREGIRTWCRNQGAGYTFVRGDEAFDDVVLRVLRHDRLVQ